MRKYMGLYRGKRTDNGEWVEGNLICWKGNMSGTHWEIAVRGINICTVDPDTVGECTGLRDKNGKLVFEGDILRLDGDELPHWLDIGQKREVKYNAGGFDPLCEYDSDCCTFVVAGDCEIIGNIYDNPELLKEETE